MTSFSAFLAVFILPGIVPAPITHLLYLHGFRSSPQSTKARQMAARVASSSPQVTWWCPQLPPSPRAACTLIQAGTALWPRASMAVIGSSLGGFYATWLAEATHCKAVLLNPAVNPARDLAPHIGEHASWHDPTERFFFKAAYVEELRALTSPAVKPPPTHDPLPFQADKLYAVIAKGDEVLDWREMTARYPGAHIELLEGGDHALSDFEAHMAGILAFLGLPP